MNRAPPHLPLLEVKSANLRSVSERSAVWRREFSHPWLGIEHFWKNGEEMLKKWHSPADIREITAEAI